MRRLLHQKLSSALLKSFPLTTAQVNELSHVESSYLDPHKAQSSDYYSHTPQLLWDTLTKNFSHKKRLEKGLWGLPDAEEIGRDLIV